MRGVVACWLLLAVLPMVWLLPATAGSRLAAQQPVQLDLQQRLEKGLEARRPVEFAFIRRVVQLVHDGRLPQPLVDRCFDWAKRKPKNKVQYFKFALRKIAADLGIDV